MSNPVELSQVFEPEDTSSSSEQCTDGNQKLSSSTDVEQGGPIPSSSQSIAQSMNSEDCISSDNKNRPHKAPQISSHASAGNTSSEDKLFSQKIHSESSQRHATQKTTGHALSLDTPSNTPPASEGSNNRFSSDPVSASSTPRPLTRLKKQPISLKTAVQIDGRFGTRRTINAGQGLNRSSSDLDSISSSTRPRHKMTASEMLALYQNSSSAENMATPESSAPSSSATVGNTHPHKKNNTPIFSHSGEAAALRPDSTYSKATALLDSWADEDEKKQDQLTQWVETGNKLYKAWSTEDKLIWDKDRADDVTRAEIREKLKHGYVLILQKTPPAECGIKASRCAHKHCSAPNKRTPLGAFRLSLEPETNVHLEKVPTQALPKKTGQGTHGVTWYCLKCVEALWNKEQSEKRPKIILKIAKEKMTGPVDPDTADQAEKMQIDTAEEMVRPKIKGTENRQPEVKGKGKRRRMEEMPVEIDETKKDKGSEVVATVDEAAPRGLRVLVAASQRRANSEGSTETASQVDKTMQAAADDQTGSPGQTGAATRSPEAQRKRQQKKNQQRKARARQQTEDSELSLNTEDSHDYHHGETKKPSTPSKQPGRAEKTYGREDLEDRKPISTPRKPDLTPFQRLYSNIIPEERNHASEYYYLSPPQLAALWKWKDVIKRREVFENPQNEAFLRRNGLLMGYDPELYLDDGEMLGAMEIGGLIIALTDAEVRDRDLSVVMGLVDTRAQVELDKEGWVPQPAPKKARKISLVLRVSMGANTPSPSAAVPAGSSGDEDTSGSDDEEDLGEARALY